MSFWSGLTYPIASIFGYESNIGKHFYEIETSETGEFLSAKKAMLVYMAFYETKHVKADLKLYEELMQNAVDVHNANKDNSVIVTLHGERGMSVSFYLQIFQKKSYRIFPILSKKSGQKFFLLFSDCC